MHEAIRRQMMETRWYSAQCSQCERLMLAAIAASRAYHNLLGDLESAHIRHDVEQLFHIQEQAAKALLERDESIRALNDHERVHIRQMAGNPIAT